MDPGFRPQFDVSVSVLKDKLLDSVEVIVRGPPGSYVGLSAVRSSLSPLLTEMRETEASRRAKNFNEIQSTVLLRLWLARECLPR